MAPSRVLAFPAKPVSAVLREQRADGVYSVLRLNPDWSHIPLAALSAALFFLYHPATFDAYWQPMYVFDVLCGTFCLLSFLAFIDRMHRLE